MPVDLKPRVKAIELAVIVPCFNERHNVAILVGKLDDALKGIAWEVIFVDDDLPDGTASIAREIATRQSARSLHSTYWPSRAGYGGYRRHACEQRAVSRGD